MLLGELKAGVAQGAEGQQLAHALVFGIEAHADFAGLVEEVRFDFELAGATAAGPLILILKEVPERFLAQPLRGAAEAR